MTRIQRAYIEMAFEFAQDAIRYGDEDGRTTWQAAYWLGKGLGGEGVYLLPEEFHI